MRITNGNYFTKKSLLQGRRDPVNKILAFKVPYRSRKIDVQQHLITIYKNLNFSMSFFIICHSKLFFLEESVRCYERRPRCLQYRGWCKAGLEFGFCSELNDLPDTPSEEHPLFEVTTFVYPKNVSLQYH